MTRPTPATWLSIATAAILCAFGCKHDPDVVAAIEASSTAGSGVANGGEGGSAGGTAGSAGSSNAGTSSAGTGTGSAGTGNGSTGSAAGTSGVMAPAGGNGGGNDAGAAGSAGTGATCQFPMSYSMIQDIVDAGCRFPAKTFPLVDLFFQQVPPEVPVGESRRPDVCDVVGAQIYKIDEETFGLCDGACQSAMDWLAQQRAELKRCMGL